MAGQRKPNDSQAIPDEIPVGSSNPASSRDSDLVLLQERWPILPPSIRAAILALVTASSSGGLR